MSCLTLEWHLRGIIEGTTEPEKVREDITYDETFDEWTTFRQDTFYTDPHTEGFRQHSSRAAADSYTTGFRQDCGEFCDTFDVPARDALKSDDPVSFLDAVANDPRKRYQQRVDAAALLDFHIWPDSPDSGSLGRGIPANRDDIDVSEWVETGLTRRTVGPTYLPFICENPDCTEGECLCDPDTLRDEGRAVCMVCATEQSIPQYP